MVMTIGHRSTLSGDSRRPGLECARARPLHRGVGPTLAAGSVRLRRDARVVARHPRAAPLPRRAPPPEVDPRRRRPGVGARPGAHRGAGVAHRLGRGGPRRRLRPAARGAAGPFRARHGAFDVERACVAEGDDHRGAHRTRGHGAAGRRRPASSSPASPAIPKRSCTGSARRTRAAGSARSRPG